MICSLQNDFSVTEFEEQYQLIYENLTTLNVSKGGRCAYVLGGQPGSGKSTFYSHNEALNEYITIDGDAYRKYHPRYDDIVKYDMENFAERTQSFTNAVVERLIKDLGNEGYNIVIEGTLRNPDVPIKTCNLLNENGYETNLVIVACDAQDAWLSTLYRAQLMQEMGEKPRFVPIDKYNAIVNNLPDNADIVAGERCFKHIHIINRNNKILYSNKMDIPPSTVLKQELNLEEWNRNYRKNAEVFIDEKIKALQAERSVLRG